jgi:hypothetical protein
MLIDHAIATGEWERWNGEPCAAFLHALKQACVPLKHAPVYWGRHVALEAAALRVQLGDAYGERSERQVFIDGQLQKIDAQQAFINDREAQYAKQHESVLSHIKLIEQQAQRIIDQDAFIAQREIILGEKQGFIVAQIAQIERQAHRIRELEAFIAEREKVLGEKQDFIGGQIKQLEEQAARIIELEAFIAEREQVLWEKCTYIKEVVALSAAQSVRIRDLEAVIADRQARARDDQHLDDAGMADPAAQADGYAQPTDLT